MFPGHIGLTCASMTGAPDLHRQLDEVIAVLGPETAARALQCAHLFHGLRRRSRDALKVARQCWYGGRSVEVVFRLSPGAGKAGERVDVRVLTDLADP